MLERAVALGIIVFGLLAAGFVLNQRDGADEAPGCPPLDACPDASRSEARQASEPATFSMAPPAPRGDDEDDDRDDEDGKKEKRAKERKKDKDDDKDERKGNGKGKRGSGERD